MFRGPTLQTLDNLILSVKVQFLNAILYSTSCCCFGWYSNERGARLPHLKSVSEQIWPVRKARKASEVGPLLLL